MTPQYVVMTVDCSTNCHGIFELLWIKRYGLSGIRIVSAWKWLGSSRPSPNEKQKWISSWRWNVHDPLNYTADSERKPIALPVL